jgi:hypothetical protein
MKLDFPVPFVPTIIFKPELNSISKSKRDRYPSTLILVSILFIRSVHDGKGRNEGHGAAPSNRFNMDCRQMKGPSGNSDGRSWIETMI